MYAIRSYYGIIVPPILLVSLQLANLLSAGLAAPGWAVYGILLFFYLMPDVRRTWITQPRNNFV